MILSIVTNTSNLLPETSRYMSVDYDRSSSALLEQISFEGRDSEDVTRFLRSVKRIAIAEGQQRDDQWLIDYAESCLAGPALEWFLDLESDALSSWKGFQRKILRRFKSDRVAPAPQAAPAASAPQPASVIPRPIATMGAFSAPPRPIEISDKAYRYLLLGDSGTGKSCFLARKISQIWAPYVTPTVGVEYIIRHVKYDDDNREEHYWDVSGREEYRDLRRKYFIGADFIYIVYDITNRKSFESVRFWVASIENSGLRVQGRSFLLGSKSDLHDKRVVLSKEGEALAAELRLHWKGEVSAKTNQGFHDVVLDGWEPVFKYIPTT